MPINFREGTLGAILYNSNIISERDINAALEEQERTGCRFGESLVNLGIVAQEDIDWALSNQLDIPYIRLKQDMIDPEALSLLPAKLCRTHQLIPLIRSGDELAVAIADPLDKAAVAAAAEASGCNINISVALLREITEMINLCYGFPDKEELGFSSSLLPQEVLNKINDDISGQQLIDSLLTYSIQQQLSSFSLQPLENMIVINGKKGATVYAIGQLSNYMYPAVSRLIRKSTGLPTSENLSQSGYLFFQYADLDICFQVMFLRGEKSDYITIRPYLQSEIPKTLDNLKLSDFQRQQFKQLASLKQGLILVASCSLQERCSFMDILLEEMELSERNVLLIGKELGRTGRQYPRIPLPADENARWRLVMDCVEHEPDILVIEDGTRYETLTAAVRAAMRGKLVLVGMDIRGTRNLFDHIISYSRTNRFMVPFLAGIVSFTGIRLLCPVCRSLDEMTLNELKALALQPPVTYYRSTGCRQCHFTGLTERIILSDIIYFDSMTLDFFENAKNGEDFLKAVYSSGYKGIEFEGEALIRNGSVSPEEYITALI